MTNRDVDDASRRDVLKGLSAAGLAMAAVAPAVTASAQAPSAPGADFGRWWTRDYRIVQTNLREIDALEDPREIARQTKDFGGTAIVSNIGGIVAFYPTALPFHYKTPYLKGDFVGEMIEAAHAQGLVYLGRFDMSKAMKPVYDAHPDWFVLSRDGKPREYEGTYQACPNGGWAKDYGVQILREGLTRYKPDGLFFNGGGFPGADYSAVNHGICVCENCQRTFRDMYGKTLPKVDNFSDPNWRDYLDYQRRVLDANSEVVDKLARDLIPNSPIRSRAGTEGFGRGELQRRVNRAAPEWQHQSGEQVRSAHAVSPGKPFSSTSTAHVDYPWRQVTETAAYHQLRFAQQLGLGARLDLYLMGTLKDQDDPGYLKPVSDLFKWEAAHSRDYTGLKPVAPVGLYVSETNNRYGGATRWNQYSNGSFRGAYSALVDSRIPFQFISGDRVADGGVKLREQFDVIVMPHVMIVPPAEAAVLDRFVSDGGLLIASGMTGAYDDRGQLLEKTALACLPTERYAAPNKVAGWSLDPSKGDFRFSTSKVPIDAYYFDGTLRPGVTDLVPFAPDQRFGPPEFSYAIPGAATRKVPGVATMAFGKGRAVQMPWLPEWQYYRDGLPVHQQLLAGLIARYAPAQKATLTGDGPVELMVQAMPSGGLLMHVVNYAGQRNGRYDVPPKLHGLSVGVLAPPAAQARLLVSGQTVKGVRRAGDRTWFDLPPVGAFEAIVVQA
jgi:hypothetical protein